jgi:hypothetical protein
MSHSGEFSGASRIPGRGPDVRTEWMAPITTLTDSEVDDLLAGTIPGGNDDLAPLAGLATVLRGSALEEQPSIGPELRRQLHAAAPPSDLAPVHHLGRRAAVWTGAAAAAALVVLGVGAQGDVLPASVQDVVSSTAERIGIDLPRSADRDQPGRSDEAPPVERGPVEGEDPTDHAPAGPAAGRGDGAGSQDRPSGGPADRPAHSTPPAQPATPATPAQPGAPGQPATPATPATPAQPGQPGGQSDPGHPGGGQPDGGGPAAEPAQPAEPAEPAQPGGSGPAVPADPAEPATPARPPTSGKQGQPETVPGPQGQGTPGQGSQSQGKPADPGKPTPPPGLEGKLPGKPENPGSPARL